MTDKEQLQSIAVIQKLPCRLGKKRAKKLPRNILGATIIDIGMAGDGQVVEGGGLVIDYMPAGSFVIRRAVFAFNEIGMWLKFESAR